MLLRTPSYNITQSRSLISVYVLCYFRFQFSVVFINLENQQHPSDLNQLKSDNQRCCTATWGRPSRRSFSALVTRPKNFSTIGQCMAEFWMIRQISPVHFTGVLILRLLNDSQSCVAELYQTVGEHSPFISFLTSTTYLRYVVTFRNKSDSYAKIEVKFCTFRSPPVKIRGVMGEMQLIS